MSAGRAALLVWEGDGAWEEGWVLSLGEERAGLWGGRPEAERGLGGASASPVIGNKASIYLLVLSAPLLFQTVPGTP